MSALAKRLLGGDEQEAVSEVHGSRWDRGWRLSAGVRRVKGGAILLNVDAGEIAEISRRASLAHLLEDIAARAPEIAYVVLEDGTNRLAYGPLADAATLAPTPSGAAFRSVPIPQALEGLAAGEFTVGSTPVLEFTGPVDTARADSPTLRLGLNLDGLRRAERRTLTRLTLSLAAALARSSCFGSSSGSCPRSTRAPRQRCAGGTASPRWANWRRPWPTRCATR